VIYPYYLPLFYVVGNCPPNVLRQQRVIFSGTPVTSGVPVTSGAPVTSDVPVTSGIATASDAPVTSGVLVTTTSNKQSQGKRQKYVCTVYSYTYVYAVRIFSCTIIS